MSAIKRPIHSIIIMEGNASEPAEIKNLDVIDKPGQFYLRFNARLQSFNVKNRNGRTYLGKAMIPSYNAPHIFELEQANSWFGEAGHPLSNDVQRILTIHLPLTSHRVKSHTVNMDYCDGVIETLNDGNGFGSRMTKLILQGMKPAFSLRALANMVTSKNGESIIDSKAHVVCPDWVVLPSHVDAYMKEDSPIERIATEAYDLGNSMTNDSKLVPVQESALLDFLALESTNVKFMSNVCEIALEGMQLSPNARSVILKEKGFRYVVPLEEQLSNIAMDYLSGLGKK